MKTKKPRINPTWEGKMSFLPGMPDDLSQMPTLHFQLIQGRVFTLLRWPNDCVARGEVSLQQLRDLTQEPLADGWYSSSGNFMGTELPGSL